MDAKKLFEAIDAMDVNAFTAFLTENIIFRFGNFPVIKGKSNVKASVEQFFSSIKGLSHRIIKTHENEKNNSLILEAEVTYTRKDNSKITIPFANIFEIENEKVSTYLIYINISPLFEK